MADKQAEKTLSVNGCEVSLSFADTKNTAVINQIKQILLSSFVAKTSKVTV